MSCAEPDDVLYDNPGTRNWKASEVTAQIRRLIWRQDGCRWPIREYTLKIKFKENLGWDPSSKVKLGRCLKTVFGVGVSPTRMRKAKTIKDANDHIKELLRNANRL